MYVTLVETMTDCIVVFRAYQVKAISDWILKRAYLKIWTRSRTDDDHKTQYRVFNFLITIPQNITEAVNQF